MRLQMRKVVRRYGYESEKMDGKICEWYDGVYAGCHCRTDCDGRLSLLLLSAEGTGRIKEICQK